LCPELLSFDCLGRHIVVMAYGAAMSAAMLTVCALGWIVAVRRGLPRWRALAVAATVTLGFPLGSRLFRWWLSGQAGSADLDSLLRAEFAGFYLPGGILVASLCGMAACAILRVDGWKMVDAMAPGLALGSAVMRVGCFLNGCCFGRETSLPWGVVFPMGSPAHLYRAAGRFDALFREPAPVHPTQLYELAAGLTAAAFAVTLLRRRLPDGVAAMSALICFLAMRWGVHSLRAAAVPSGLAGHALYAGAILLAAGCLTWAALRQRRSV